MRRFLYALSAAALIVASPLSAADMTLVKYPTVLVKADTTFRDLEGYQVDIPDMNLVDFIVPNLDGAYLMCASIHPSFKDGADSARALCDSREQSYTCSGLYNIDTRFKPATRSNDLVPFMPIHKWVSTYSKYYPTQNVIAINNNFFNTKAFPNRSTNTDAWKPIFMEACGLNLGTFKETNASYLLGEYSHAETSGSGAYGTGTADKKFGTVAFDSFGLAGITKVSTATTDSNLPSTTGAISGVMIRHHIEGNFAKTAVHIPAFVAANWDKTVARTAVGFSATAGQKMRIVVIQPGAANAATKGVTVDQLQKFFPATDFRYVMLLDGGGSAQLAANFAHTNTHLATSPARVAPDCLYAEVQTCTARGNYVDSFAVAHWSAYLKKDGPTSDKKLVDRWVPQVLIIKD